MASSCKYARNSAFHKMRGIYWAGEGLLSSLEGLCLTLLKNQTSIVQMLELNPYSLYLSLSQCRRGVPEPVLDTVAKRNILFLQGIEI